MSAVTLDVRALRKPDKHPRIFQQFAATPVGESFVLVNNHDPLHLHEEFQTDHPGEFGWEYQERGPQQWAIRITRLASTALPRILCDTSELVAGSPAAASGAVWKLQMNRRDLDSNIIQLPAGGKIEAHAGPDLDVLLHILGGDGQLRTEVDTLTLRPGALLWLPRRSRREISAGADGLTYFTVHQRRPGLTIGSAPTGPGVTTRDSLV